MSEHGKLTLPMAYRVARLYEIRPRKGGGFELIPQRRVDASQAWFWSERWQAMEREADAAIAAGQVQQFDSADDLLTELGKL